MKVFELCIEYSERHSKRFKKPKSCRDDQYILNKYILPTIGHLDIDKLKKADIEILHASMYQHTRRANQTVVLIRCIYKKAIDWGYVDRNPAIGIDYYPEKSREEFIPKSQGIRLFATINKQKEPFKGLFTFLLTTGCRKSEALNLKWQDVDFESKFAIFRDTKNGRDHYVPLVPLALEAIKNQKRVGDYVFMNARYKKPYQDIKKPWQKLMKEFGAYYRLHSLRRTLGSWLAQQGESLATIGAILNHKDVRSTLIYSRFQLEHLREPIEKTLDFSESQH